MNGLEAYKIIEEEYRCAFGGTANGDRVRKNLPIIEKELKENERLKTSYLENMLNEESKEYIYKKLEALEIIKKKRVRVVILLNKDNVEDYNSMIDFYCSDEQLTKEEFDLLKGC